MPHPSPQKILGLLLALVAGLFFGVMTPEQVASHAPAVTGELTRSIPVHSVHASLDTKTLTAPRRMGMGYWC